MQKWLRILFVCTCFIVGPSACQQVNPRPANVHITLFDQIEKEVISSNAIEIYELNSNGSTGTAVIARAVTDDLGAAHFSLPKGTYRAIPAGSWSGSVDFSLSTDTQEMEVKLTVFKLFN